MQISTKEKIKMAQTLITKAINVSEKTKHDVFVEWSPQVNWLEARIYVNGWKNGKNSYIEFRISFHPYNDYRAEYNAAIRKLDELLKNEPEKENSGDAETSPEPKDNTLS